MSTDKIKAKIAQNETDQSRLREEGQKLQEQLAALDKPKLRHGNYGIEDLEEFKVRGGFSQGFVAKIREEGIGIASGADGVEGLSYTLDEVTEIIQKLSRLRTTLIKKTKK